MADRFYDFPGDDRRYVSVTSFLSIINKPFLYDWYAKQERELIKLLAKQGKSLQDILEYLEPKQPYGARLSMEVSAEWGTKLHRAIDYTLKDLKLPKLTKEERKVYDKWKEWWNSLGYELLGAERVIKSEQYGYAGTLDALVRDQQELLIIDWKTGKNHYAEHVLQNLAYQRALPKEGEALPDGGLLVYIPKDKDIWTVPVPQVTPELFQPVLDALSLWRWANNKRWENK